MKGGCRIESAVDYGKEKNHIGWLISRPDRASGSNIQWGKRKVSHGQLKGESKTRGHWKALQIFNGLHGRRDRGV